MKRYSPSIREEVDELEAATTATGERIRALRSLRTARFSDSDSATERLTRELDSEEANADAARRQLAAAKGRLEEARQRGNEVERAVFSLATGALALSVTFSDSLIPEDPQALNLLRDAWILLTVSVIAYPFGGMAEVIDELGFRPRWLWAFLRHWLPSIGFIGFAAGVLSFLRFALQNLPPQ